MYMIGYFVFVGIYICQTVSFENNYVSCKNCKWFTLPKGQKEEYGICTFFSNRDINNKEKPFFYEFADHCRKNNNLCSKEGVFFEEYIPHNLDENKEFSYDKIYSLGKIFILETELAEFKNKVYGEVNEKNDLDDIDRNIRNLTERLRILQKEMMERNKK